MPTKKNKKTSTKGDASKQAERREKERKADEARQRATLFTEAEDLIDKKDRTKLSSLLAREQFLITHGRDYANQTNNGPTLLHYTCTRIAVELKRAKPGISPNLEPLKEIMTDLLDQGANARKRDHLDRIPLMIIYENTEREERQPTVKFYDEIKKILVDRLSNAVFTEGEASGLQQFAYITHKGDFEVHKPLDGESIAQATKRLQKRVTRLKQEATGGTHVSVKALQHHQIELGQLKSEAKRLTEEFPALRVIVDLSLEQHQQAAAADADASSTSSIATATLACSEEEYETAFPQHSVRGLVVKFKTPILQLKETLTSSARNLDGLHKALTQLNEAREQLTQRAKERDDETSPMAESPEAAQAAFLKELETSKAVGLFYTKPNPQSGQKTTATASKPGVSGP